MKPLLHNQSPSVRILETSPPLSPSPYQGEGGDFLKRGADAPLKHPSIINRSWGESRRGEASLT